MRYALALLLSLWTGSVALAASTVNPNTPAQNAPLASAPVRGNFAAAQSDINNILGCYAGTTAPSNPINFQSWCDTTASPNVAFKAFNLHTNAWVTYGTLNVNTGVWSPVISPGLYAATSPLTLSFPAGVVTYGMGIAHIANGGLGATSFTAGLPIIGNGASDPTQGTRTGNTTLFATGSGSYTATNCIKSDASGNHVDAGAPCGVGSNVSYVQDFLGLSSTTGLPITNFTGSISATTLTVSAISGGAISVGTTIGGSGVAGGTVVTNLLTGTGGTGTYTVNNSQTVGSEAMTGLDFVAGTTTSLTIPNAPLSTQSTAVFFDGNRQASNTWSLSGSTVTFLAAIPLNTQVVEVTSLTTTILPTWVTSIGGVTGNVGVSNGVVMSGANIIADQKWRGFITSAQFGTVCDWTTINPTPTDDSVAMQAFFTAQGVAPYPLGIINGTSGGYGCYMNLATLSLPPDIFTTGGTAQTELIWNASKTGSMIQAASPSSFGITLQNLIIEGQTKGSQTAIRIRQTSLWNLRNIIIQNVDTCVLFDAAGVASNYQWGERVTCYQANIGYDFEDISNSNTLIGSRCNVVVICIIANGNNLMSIGVAMEVVTTGIFLSNTSAGYTSVGDRCEQATTCYLTQVGASKLAILNPHFASVTTEVNDPANALINSFYEYRLTVAVAPGLIPAHTAVDIGPITTGVMNNCKLLAAVTATPDAATLVDPVWVAGEYRAGSGPYIRVLNYSTAPVTPSSFNVVLNCLARS